MHDMVYLKCACGSTAWRVTQKVFGCALCGKAIGLQLEPNAHRFPEISTAKMNRVLGGENPVDVYGITDEEWLKSQRGFNDALGREGEQDDG